MNSIELAHALATKVLGLIEVGEYWCSGQGEHSTGLKVATRLGHLPHEGYFRPDKSYWQLKLLEFGVWRGSLGRANVAIEWAGKKMRVVINDGDIETTLERVWEIEESNQSVGECILQWAEDSERFEPLNKVKQQGEKNAGNRGT